MADPISAIVGGIRPVDPLAVKASAPTGPSFADAFKDAIGEVERMQQVADAATGDLATGRSTDIAATMIAVQKADVTFQLMLQIRNRLLEAYQELQRVQV